MPKLTTQLVMLIALVALIALVVFAGPAACNKIRALGAQTRMDNAQTQGRVKAEGEAMNTVGNNSDRADQTDETVKEGSDAIRNAPGSDAKVDPRSNDAAHRAACRLRSYRDTSECRALLGADPSELDQGSAPGRVARRPDRR